MAVLEPSVFNASLPAVGASARSAEGGQNQNGTRLRQLSQDYVAFAFYGTLMRQFRNSAVTRETRLSPKRAEKIFTSLLDQELVTRAGRASRFTLADAVYRQLKRRPEVRVDPALLRPPVPAQRSEGGLEVAG